MMYAKITQDMYNKPRKSVKNMFGEMEDNTVKICSYQGSALSLFLL